MKSQHNTPVPHKISVPKGYTRTHDDPPGERHSGFCVRTVTKSLFSGKSLRRRGNGTAKSMPASETLKKPDFDSVAGKCCIARRATTKNWFCLACLCRLRYSRRSLESTREAKELREAQLKAALAS